MITRRDQDILNAIETFHVLTVSQIHRLFFHLVSPRYTRRRLKYLADQGYIKRTRSTIDNSYAYYIDKKSLLQQIHHDLIRAELYVTLKQRYDVLEWHNEYTIDHIRPDALAYIKHGTVHPVLVEVHLSNQFNFDKYKMDFMPIFGVKPTIIICTDRHINIPSTQKFRIVGIDYTGVVVW